MKNIIINIFLLLVLMFVLSCPIFANQDAKTRALEGALQIGREAGITEDGSALVLAKKIANYIEVFLSFLGVIALVLMVYAGYLWMTAGGNDEQVKKAKNIMRNAVIGLIIILMSGALSVYIESKLITSSNQ